MKIKAGVTAMTLAGAIVLSAGCGGGQAATKDANGTSEMPQFKDPVQLTIYAHNVTLTDAEFDNFFVAPMQKKYPNIKLTLQRSGQKGASLEELITAGQVPDLIFSSNGYIDGFKKLDLPNDIQPLVKKDNVDLSRFDEASIDAIKQFGEQGQLYALPLSLNYGAMYYNKDIFDKFGVPYPKDLITYNEALDIAKKLTRTVDGVSYIGLEPGFPDALAGQLSFNLVDPGTLKPRLESDTAKRIVTFLKQVYDIPGQVGANGKFQYNRDTFIKDQTLAMLPDYSNGITGLLEENEQKSGKLNWDVAGMPNFDEALGTGRSVDIHLLVMTKQSKNKEAAFEVMKAAISDGAVKNVLRGKMKEIAVSKKDVNTALREAQEAAEKAVQEEKMKN